MFTDGHDLTAPRSSIDAWRRSVRARTYRLANSAIHHAMGWVRFHGAIAPGTTAAERFGAFGKGSVIAFPPSSIYGESEIHVGTRTMISTHVTLCAGYSPEQDPLPERALVIGDRCVIGARSGIVAHESIQLGDDVWFGQDVYVTDANHGYQDPDVPIGRQMGKHAPVRIGSGSWIGHGTVVLPGTTIGRNVVVAAGSVVRGDVPDHAVVGGVPARIIRAYVPGEGWARPDGSVDVRSLTLPSDPEELMAEIVRLGEEAARPAPPPDR